MFSQYTWFSILGYILVYGGAAFVLSLPVIAFFLAKCRKREKEIIEQKNIENFFLQEIAEEFNKNRRNTKYHFENGKDFDFSGYTMVFRKGDENEPKNRKERRHFHSRFISD